MALGFVATIKRWQGLSSDAKPSTDVPEGSTFHVIDLGEEYIYVDGTWERDLRMITALRDA